MYASQHRRRDRRMVPALALVGLGAMTACSDLAEPLAVSGGPSDNPVAHGPRDGGRDLTVLTHNTYVGADLAPLFGADPTAPDFLSVVNAAWTAVQQSEIAERAEALADEIADGAPHVVGLQEVFQFVEFDASSGTPTVVQTLDMLQALMAALGSRGLDYSLAGVQVNTSGALPLAALPTNPPTFTRFVQFADADVVLARGDVDLQGSAAGAFQDDVPLPGGLILSRGWVRVELEHGGTTYHVLNTHLEGQSLPSVQAAQVDELLESVLAGLDGVTVLIGDLNSDAAAGPGAPSWTPTYDRLLDAGFVDAWVQAHPGGNRPGYTCCQDPDLRNAASNLDERIDFVLVRSGSHPGPSWRLPGRISADVVGDELSDLTDPTGLWPADHAGLLASLRLAPVVVQ